MEGTQLRGPLSDENQTQGKLGWDATEPRIATFAKLRHNKTDTDVLGLCTQFDLEGQQSRKESAKSLMDDHEWIKRTNNNPNSTEYMPHFLAGVFNTATEGDTWQIISANSTDLKDAQFLAKKSYGNWYTTTGMPSGCPSTGGLSDYIFVGRSGEKHWDVLGHGILSNNFEGSHNSDHRAVVVDLMLLN